MEKVFHPASLASRGNFETTLRVRFLSRLREKRVSNYRMKKKSSIYLRYEFSNESGKPEGGDIFEFVSLQDAREMTSQILEVAKGDDVAVNLTIGSKKAFFGLLGNLGLKKHDAEAELVTQKAISFGVPKSTKKKTAKKSAKKSVKKRK